MKWLTSAATIASSALCLAGSATSAHQNIAVPAQDGSGMYSLASSADGRVYLSWVESAADGYRLEFSALVKNQWTRPRTIARGKNWFVNWEDHPSMAALQDGSLVAHWLVTNDGKPGSYNYGVRLARSVDGGATWRDAGGIGTENGSGYTGFVSIAAARNGFDAVYLTPPVSEGRPRPEELHASHADHKMTLAHASFDSDGVRRSSEIVDVDTCTCCSTAIAQTSAGLIAAYRDHEPDEVRDISIVRHRDGQWSAPRPVHRDGWQFNGCPTNGPAMASNGNRVAVAWFTAAGGVPKLQLAFSNDAGERFDPPLEIDGGQPAGWPAIVLLDDGSAIVSWLEAIAGGAGEVRLRRVQADGRVERSMTIATAHAGSSTGVPQMVRSGNSLIVAWRDGRVRTALVPIPAR